MILVLPPTESTDLDRVLAIVGEACARDSAPIAATDQHRTLIVLSGPIVITPALRGFIDSEVLYVTGDE